MAALAVAAWMHGGASVRAQTAAPAAVRILEPADNSYVTGAVPIRVSIEPPTVPVLSVSFFVDGKRVCLVEHAPYECPWNAGRGFAAHEIRVVVALVTGERLKPQIVRTRAVDYSENVDVDAIKLPVLVTSHDQYVRRLTSEDFRVFEDGVEQKVTGFASEDIPLEIVAAIDISTSMTDSIPAVKEVVKTFLKALRPADQVRVIGFNTTVYTVAPPSADLATRLREVDQLSAFGITVLYDAIVQSLDLLGQQEGRRALVVFTDGEDQGSVVPLQVAEQRAQASDATLYLIAQGRATKLQDLKRILEGLAKTSGGRAFITEDNEKLRQAFAEIVAELSAQYLLVYVPTHDIRDGKLHKIKVEMRNGGYRVRARDTYLYPVRKK